MCIRDSYGKGNVWEAWEEDCLPYSETSGLSVWNSIEGDDYDEWCVITASNWINWGIYQPTKYNIIDFAGVNGHADPETGRNAALSQFTYPGNLNGIEKTITESRTFTVENLGVNRIATDVGCNFRTSTYGLGVHSQTMTLQNSLGENVWSMEGNTCTTETIYLDSGATYILYYSTTSSGINESITMITDFSATSYQPLLLNDDGTALIREGNTKTIEEMGEMAVKNPTFHKNPKSLDAKLIYSLFIPCLGVGAMVFMLMRSMATVSYTHLTLPTKA